jgi:hypothetical protein
VKRLIIIPFVCAVIAAFGMALDASSDAMFYRGVLIAAAFVTAVSAFITTSKFVFGDKLYASWLFVGIGYTLSTIRYSLRLAAMIRGGGDLLPRAALDAMLVLQNVAIAVALLMFVLAWRSTGLSTGGWGLTALGVGVALVIGGYPLIQGFQTRSADTVLLISTLGDVVGIALIVPLAMSARALRGGLLMHTWLYLALCEFFWMLYDIWLAVRDSLGVAPRAGVGVEQMIRVTAIMFAFIATVAQRRAAPRS